MTLERQPTNESELRKQLRGRRVLVCVPVGDATELVETTIEEAVWLWLLAQERDSPKRVHLGRRRPGDARLCGAGLPLSAGDRRGE